MAETDTAVVAAPPVLEAHGISAAYGNLQVLFDVDLSVRSGEVLAVLGPNGAGKSTLLRALAGLHPISSGSLMMLSEDVTRSDARARVQRGLLLVEGGRAVFPGLSVEDNLRVGLHLRRREPRSVRAAAREAALEMFPVLTTRLNQRAGTLSGGERQMLAIAKALLVDAQVLCIDELSLGLAPIVVQQLVDRVAQVRAAGRTMIIVEQSVSVALELSDHVVLLEKGQVKLAGATETLRNQLDHLQDVMLGGAT